MKILFNILFFVSLTSFAQENNYKKNFNASLALIKKTVKSKGTNTKTSKQKLIETNLNSTNNTKQLSALIDKNKIKHLENSQNKSTVKLLETNGKKRQLIKHIPIETKPINENAVRQLKGILNIPE